MREERRDVARDARAHWHPGVPYSSRCRARILPKGVVGIFRAIRTHPIGAQLDEVDVQLFMQSSRPPNALTT